MFVRAQPQSLSSSYHGHLDCACTFVSTIVVPPSSHTIHSVTLIQPTTCKTYAHYAMQQCGSPTSITEVPPQVPPQYPTDSPPSFPSPVSPASRPVTATIRVYRTTRSTTYRDPLGCIRPICRQGPCNLMGELQQHVRTTKVLLVRC